MLRKFSGRSGGWMAANNTLSAAARVVIMLRVKTRQGKHVLTIWVVVTISVNSQTKLASDNAIN